ncbi:PLP-dependent transferase [Mycena olivaceomarginata]|nr:PLP-dependent transferase [Mycena olivaceomarginata]
MLATGIISWLDKLPPQFGHAMLEYYPFDSEYLNLNHGDSYGSLPLPVMDACKVMDWEAQSHPDRFMRFDFAPRLTDVRQRIAALIGAKTDECVLVPNASTGISTILRNIQWTGDDIIVVFNTSFRSVAHAAQFISDIPPHPAVITQFRDHLRRLPRNADQKTVAIIDSIISVPGILLLWKEMVQIDAAHSIGQETNLDLNTADPDFWTSNCHKWLYTKLSCAVLYVPLRTLSNRHSPTSEAYASLSGRTEPNFVEQFELVGRGREDQYLLVGQIAIQGSDRLVQILGTAGRALDPSGEMTLNMGMGWWIRCSAQVWTEVGDFEKLGKALLAVCPEIVQEPYADEAELKSRL